MEGQRGQRGRWREAMQRDREEGGEVAPICKPSADSIHYHGISLCMNADLVRAGMHSQLEHHNC